ncbi:MAG: PAS domain S-box protein, partial [Chitinophagia bacterium]|nr:PAS domain S-box protein [Chitinophagia bacterium]
MTHLTDNGADSLADKQKEIGYKVANHIGALLSYWDTDTVCRYANGAFKDWFGISHTDLIGKRMEEAFGEVYKKNVPHIQAVLAGQAQSFEREITIPSGEQKIYLASYYPDIEDGKVIGFYVHSADITEIMLLERQLKASEAKFKNLLDSTPDAMIIMNEQGIMQLVNNKCEDVFGYKKEELVNNHISMLSPKDFNMIQFYKAGSEAIKNAEQPTQSGIIMHGLRKNGQGFPAEVSISPIGMEGSVLLSAAFRDISPNIEKEEFLLKSMAVVSEQNKKLINFAHIVSHNLRSHSGNLEAILQLITETDDEEECAEMMPHLLKISAGFKETVRHLNEIVAIESKRDLTIETLNLHDYVNKALEPLVMDIKNAGIAITNNVPKDMELKYNA